MQVVSRALVDDPLVGRSNGGLLVHVVVMALGALIIGLCAVLGAGGRSALNLLKVLAAAGAGAVILMAGG